jgi:hypothetical protein
VHFVAIFRSICQNGGMPKTPPLKSRTLASGRLRIGDEWNAINIIARTQTHPLKAVCELAENALDAGAREVVIIRRRTQHEIFLEIVDDGKGVARGPDGLPDFGRIATHVCDSMKRQLAEQERQGIHGEFGIGMLSFWSLGESLRIQSAGADGRLYEMQLGRGNRNYTICPVRGRLSTGGTRVAVGPLLPATRSLVTGEKLQRYLSEELRDRIRNSGARVRVLDRVTHKQFDVEPREFSGERLALPARQATAFGDLLVELYNCDGDDGERGVAICKDGTRVLRDIGELEQFQHSPWIDGRVQGVLDFGAFSLAPGTRSGIVPDERLGAFCEAVQAIEPEVLAEISRRDQAESARASRDILRQVHRAFVSALRDLPSNEYLFFDIPDAKSATGKPGAPSDEPPTAPGMPMHQPARHLAQDDTQAEPDQILFPLEAGPLASVRITPRIARREPGVACRLSAVAHDANGMAILAGVEFEWRVAEGPGVLGAIDGGCCSVTSTETGQVVVEVHAKQSGLTATDRATVKFRKDFGDTDADSGRGLPSYRLEAEHGRMWRSRYDLAKNEIVINSAHRDFIASKLTAAKHRRYVGKLYAKEVVLINFPHDPAAEVLERLIELTLRTEDVL